MNETTLSFHVKKPLIAPARTAQPSAIAMPGTTGTPCVMITTAAIAPASAWIDPTARSISAVIRTTVRPAATIAMFDDWSRMLKRFSVVRKYGDEREVRADGEQRDHEPARPQGAGQSRSESRADRALLGLLDPRRRHGRLRPSCSCTAPGRRRSTPPA